MDGAMMTMVWCNWGKYRHFHRVRSISKAEEVERNHAAGWYCA
jgi:hypothetical protein